MQINNGDTVLVRVKVRDQNPTTGPYVRVEGVERVVCVPRSDIVSVEPRALQVGDRVRIAGGTGVISAIEEAYAWVRSEQHYRYETYTLSELRLAD